MIIVSNSTDEQMIKFMIIFGFQAMAVKSFTVKKKEKRKSSVQSFPFRFNSVLCL